MTAAVQLEALEHVAELAAELEAVGLRVTLAGTLTCAGWRPAVVSGSAGLRAFVQAVSSLRALGDLEPDVRVRGTLTLHVWTSTE